MNPRDDREGRCTSVKDSWAAYRGKYPDPTPAEYRLIYWFLDKFAFEYDDFVEDDNETWVSFKKRIGCNNLRSLLLKFLTQVRQSKGYDVDLYLDFSGTHWQRFRFTIFEPRRLDEKQFYDEAMAASMFVIGKINTQMMARGNSYELVRVEKLVLANPNHRWLRLTFAAEEISTTDWMLLLTFTAKEILTKDLETFQAMVVYENTPSTFQLKEWKFKSLSHSTYNL